MIGGDASKSLPEVVATEKALEASADGSIPEVLAKFHGLVDPSMAIAEIRRLRITEMETEAFLRAALQGKREHNETKSARLQSDGPRVVEDTVISENVRGAQAGDDDLCAVMFSLGKS